MLPARGGKVIVVRGAEKGATGKLLAKNKETETALVQVSTLRVTLAAQDGWRFKLWGCDERLLSVLLKELAL